MWHWDRYLLFWADSWEGGGVFRWQARRNSQRLQSSFIVLENVGSTSCSHGNTGMSRALSSFTNARCGAACELRDAGCSFYCMKGNKTALLRIITTDKNQIRGGDRKENGSRCLWATVHFRKFLLTSRFCHECLVIDGFCGCWVELSCITIRHFYQATITPNKCDGFSSGGNFPVCVLKFEIKRLHIVIIRGLQIVNNLHVIFWIFRMKPLWLTLSYWGKLEEH